MYHDDTVTKRTLMPLKRHTKWMKGIAFTLTVPMVAGVDSLFVVNGVIMGSADLGNLNFGYVMPAFWVPIPVQLIDAGAAHINDHGLYHIENLLHFDDSPRCRYFTAMGRRWYKYGSN